MRVGSNSNTLLLVALLLLPLALPAHAQDRDDAVSHYAPTPPVSYPGGVKSLRDVQYAEISGFRPLTLDLYLPSSGGARKPGVIFIHGGAWRHRDARSGGMFKDFPAVLASVAARGYVVASVNYRFVGEAKFPGPVQDVGRAIRWLRLHATEYNLDASKIILWGSSAGGQIASLLGTACGVAALEPPQGDAKKPLPSTCVQGVIDWYGVIDLESLANPTVENYLGCELPKCPPGFARSASPLAYVDAKDPPFLIQHGAADSTVPPQQAQKLYDALRAAGVPAEIVLYPNVSHGFARVPEGGADEATNKRALDKVFDFLANVTAARGPTSADRAAPGTGTR